MHRSTSVRKTFVVVAFVVALVAALGMVGVQSAEAKSITGVKAADKQITKVVKKYKKNLNKCMKWAATEITYATTGGKSITKTSQMTSKRMKTEAKNAFVNKKGNCYTFATAGYYLAKQCGYNAKLVVGTYTSSAGKKQTYSWTSVKVKGKWLIYDLTNYVYDHSRLGIKPADALYAQFAEVK